MHRLLVILAGLLNTYAYVQMVLPQCAGLCIRVHREIIAGTELAPYRYRVLVPLLTQPFIGADEASFTAAYIGFHLIAFVTMMLVLHAWLRTWTTPGNALAGVLLVAVYMPLFLTVYAYSPNTPVEMIFLCGGLLALTSYERAKAQPESPAAKRRMGRLFVGFGALVIAATLNRETAILLPIAFASVTRDGRRALLLFALWGATYGAVRLAQGWDAPVILTLGQTWQRNTSEYLDLTIIHNGLLLPLLALAAWKARRAPQFLRRAGVIIPLYAVMFIAGALWHEVRLWMPVLAVALPIMLREETIGGANDS